ncbi:MAG TPA: ATP-dependent helicase, partial [Polyangiaceae bacterium]|nr:ATP-dependent helicase [Polyangiaceae bacterium]
IERVDALDDIPAAAREGCRALEKVVVEARKDLFGAKKPPSEVARSIAEKVAMRAAIDVGAPTPDVAVKRWNNVEGVLGTLGRREAKSGPTGSLEGLAAFLQMLTMDVEVEVEDTADVVTLSTLHGSKGLEFEAVFLIGCEEGYLPHARTLETRATDVVPSAEGDHAADIEEERRLFYVGVTRAKELLTLSRARNRLLRGKPVARTPSRFLMDVPAALLEEAVIKEEAPTSAAEATAAAEAILAMLSQGPPRRR